MRAPPARFQPSLTSDADDFRRNAPYGEWGRERLRESRVARFHLSKLQEETQVPSVFDRLEQDWERFAARQPCAELADVCHKVGASSLGELVQRVRVASPVQSDTVFAVLAGRAPSSDCAARIMLQLLMPGACRLACSWWALGDAEERAATALAAVYHRIRTYPIERRPTKIAANILLDAGQDLWRAAKKASRDAAHLISVDPQAMPLGAGENEPHPAEVLLKVLDDAVASGLIAAGDAELIAATRIEGRRMAELAEERGAKLRTLQWRRQMAEAALVGTGSAA